MCSCCDDETAVNCEFLKDIIQQNCDECDPDNTVPNGCHINACSKYCGGGTKTRTRQVTPDNNNIEELMFIKIKLCDGGIETRTRTINGNGCIEGINIEEERPCNTHSCLKCERGRNYIINGGVCDIWGDPHYT
eukprot:738998_1